MAQADGTLEPSADQPSADQPSADQPSADQPSADCAPEWPDRVHELIDAIATTAGDLSLDRVLHRIVESACSLVGSRYGALGVLEPDGSLGEFIATGVDDIVEAAIGRRPEGRGVLGLLIAGGNPIRLEDLSSHPASAGLPPGHPPMRSFLGVPIRVRGTVYGSLYLAEKYDGTNFTDTDERLVVALSAAAGVAIANARLHHQLADLALLEDRERIARDLHDTVIQRLFAAGMSLQSTAGLAEPGLVRDRLEDAVSAIDDTIADIRATIFALEVHPRGLGRAVLDMVGALGDTLGLHPTVVLDGPLDAPIDPLLVDHVLATVREALTNVARHAEADTVTVALSVGDDLVLTVTDDGLGLPHVPRTGSHGLQNLADRARLLGGHLEVGPGPTKGTQLVWRVPIGPVRP